MAGIISGNSRGLGFRLSLFGYLRLHASDVRHFLLARERQVRLPVGPLFTSAGEKGVV